MYCPVCKAEYREGFARCADCDVELVRELPVEALVRQESANGAESESEEDPFCAFWSGDDPRIHAELCELLDKEKIPHKTARRADHLFHISRYPEFQIGIPFSMFERAEAIVKDAYGSETEPPDPIKLLPSGKWTSTTSRTVSPWLATIRGFARSRGTDAGEARAEDSPLAEEPALGEELKGSRGGWDPENWFPEDATVEIWAGEQPEMAELLAASVGENQIHARVAEAGRKLRMFVMPDDETRAREIVRQVVEGISPE
jgi:hypothetical protein